MTELFEFEEADDSRPIENSHLVRTRCKRCGEAEALCVPERRQTAVCGACALTEAGADGAQHGVPGPVVRFGIFATGPLAEAVETFPPPTYVGPVGWDEVLDQEFVQVPQAVLSLAEYARENSWEVRAQYTRGRFPHGTTGRPGAEKHVISLRFGGHPMTDRQAYAIYATSVAGTPAWTWGSIAIWGPDLPPFLGCGVTELREYLGGVGLIESFDVNVWVRDIKRGREFAERARKAREAKRAEIRREFSTGRTVEFLAWQYGETVEDVSKMVAKRSSGAKKEAGG